MASVQKYKTVDEYINLQPELTQKTLMQLRKIIKASAPDAEEVISFQMPAYRQNGMLVWFSVTKSHFGFYVIPEVLKEFQGKLSNYEISKSAIRFPLDKPIPKELIAEIVKCAVDVNLAKKILRDSAKLK
jgi:uncharacterized protein YdhG (YjbR/CyaY superfamily)